MVLTWGGGGADKPPPCPHAFWSLSDWVARLFKTIVITFFFSLFDKTIEMSKIEKLDN